MFLALTWLWGDYLILTGIWRHINQSHKWLFLPCRCDKASFFFLTEIINRFVIIYFRILLPYSFGALKYGSFQLSAAKNCILENCNSIYSMCQRFSFHTLLSGCIIRLSLYANNIVNCTTLYFSLLQSPQLQFNFTSHQHNNDNMMIYH